MGQMTMPRRTEEPSESDFGTPEARRQAFFVIEQPDPEQRASRRLRVETQDMVDWYLKRDLISQVQADALRKWHTDAYLSGLLPACIGGYQQSVRGGQSELSDLRIAAQSRRSNAIAFVTKLRRDAAVFIDAVTVNGKSAGRWWMEHIGGPPSEALDIMGKLANGLARHYGIAK